jgi:hypothetical protein
MWRCVITFLTASLLLVGALGCGGGNVSNNPQGPKDVKGPGVKSPSNDKGGVKIKVE